jgi:hypothetical protein
MYAKISSRMIQYNFTSIRLLSMWPNNNNRLMRLTRVMPIAPTFSLYDVRPHPVPNIPAKMQPIPSTHIPASNSRMWRYVQ